MIVVDTNAIAYLFLTGEHSATAERVFEKDNLWAAPVLWRSELRNVLALYLRKDLMSLAEASSVIALASDLLRGNEYDAPSDEILRLASESGCSAYDCEFVVVAQDLGVPLVTADKQLARTFPNVAVPLTEFAR
ncbi:MAG: type II toxin-antitoxin system VapC family toxin [bacterium]|nr:type II toxin-antitoxin system VapC family toxin [bacterium]